MRRKQGVVSELLSRIEIRRMAHEMAQVAMMMGGIGGDVEDVRCGWEDGGQAE